MVFEVSDMLWKKIKNFFKRKQGAAVVAAALASQVAYGQNEPKTEDKKQDKTEKIVLQNISTDFGMRRAINENPFCGNTHFDVNEIYKKYIDSQKKAGEKGSKIETDTIPFHEYVKDNVAGYFNSKNKNIYRRYIKVEDTDQVLAYVKEQCPNLSYLEQILITEKMLNMIKQCNDSTSLTATTIIAHEAQHMISDKNDIMAPGLSITQFGIIAQVEEINAAFSTVLLVDKYCQNKINQGIPAEEVFEVFDRPGLEQLDFYKDAYPQKEKLGTDKFQALLWKQTRKRWEELYQEAYTNSIRRHLRSFGEMYDIGSLAFGNDQEFLSRINTILEGVKDNPILKKAGVKVGNFTKYLNDQDKIVPLSPKLQNEAHTLTLLYTGMTPEFAKKLSDEMPGDQKEDAINLISVISQRPVPKEIAEKFDYKLEPDDEMKDISKKPEKPLSAAQKAALQSTKLQR